MSANPERTHEAGAAKFGDAWFLANRYAVMLARDHGIDPSRHAAFLTEVAWELLTWRETHTAASRLATPSGHENER